MLDNILQRFSIHSVALSSTMSVRKEGWLAVPHDPPPLAYRIGRGINTPHKIFDMSLTASEAAVLFRFQLTFACRVFEQSVIDNAPKHIGPEQLPPVCEVHAVYEADYLVKDSSGTEDEFDAESLNSFGKHNVPYHVWPFFREHLHSTLSKMQIGPIVIHTLQVPKSHQKKQVKKKRRRAAK